MVKRRRILLAHDIIHVHGVTPFLLWYFPLRVIEYSKPVYCTYHGFERDPIPLLFRFLRRFTNRFVKSSICMGDFIEEFYGIKCNYASIGGVDEGFSIDDDATGAIFVGRLENDTGILNHLKAIEILKKDFGITLPIQIIGRGSLENEIRTIMKQSDIDLQLLGTVDNPRVNMKNSQLCLAAGYLSILEGMSTGLPVVGYANTPLKHAYLKAVRRRGGPISIQTTTRGVATEIRRILNNTELYNKIKKQGIEFADKMSWENLASIYHKLWSTN